MCVYSETIFDVESAVSFDNIQYSVENPTCFGFSDGSLILNGLNAAILVVDQNQYAVRLNAAAEHFLSTSAANIIGEPLGKFIPIDSPVFILIDQAQKEKQALSKYNLISFYKEFLSILLSNPSYSYLKKISLIQLFSELEYKYQKSYRKLIHIESMFFQVYYLLTSDKEIYSD